MARPTKSTEEKCIARQIRFHPVLWQELEDRIPISERSAFIRHAVKAALMRRAATKLARYYAEDQESLEWARFAGDDPDEQR